MVSSVFNEQWSKITLVFIPVKSKPKVSQAKSELAFPSKIQLVN